MENTHRNTAQNEEPIYYGADTEVIERYYASQNPDPDNDDKDKEEEEEEGDWGHVDPAEGNSPFPDSNDPSGPGSAV
ncbi:hypothetical protein [Flavobacterium wongokense]|uniref:hypothetical protein n=1 Tax=Flavobacterium wongokense TaxID=2910674 RepID=UPI001F477183|nr:hypothetical protein [Flavobacterium sp. WG47]MCF6130885.1 hypothetical protein [Flavobacterium sp. WG47]